MGGGEEWPLAQDTTVPVHAHPITHAATYMHKCFALSMWSNGIDMPHNICSSTLLRPQETNTFKQGPVGTRMYTRKSIKMVMY